MLAALPAEPAGTAPFGSLAAVLLLLTGYAVLRFTSYGRLQYITAAMLGRWVPKGGVRVIQIGGGTRDLYYYPKDTILVTAISPKLKKGLMGQAAIQAGIPVDVRQETPSSLSFQGNSSVEAVVCLQSLKLLPDLPRFLAEAHRVLKPGSPFIFLQPVKGEGLTGATQLLLGGAGNAIDEKDLNGMRSAGFDSVEWDIALAAQNPHAVGVALKSGNQEDPSESMYAQRISQGSKPRRKTAKTGFGKT
ncbi:hypothetical protein ABBQ38_008636 [Trebouxia sp. C0009 RCD-2024]